MPLTTEKYTFIFGYYNNMGTYLSTPILEQGLEEGEDLNSNIPCAWGVVDMQGWRKTMEDAHVAQTDVMPPSSTSDQTIEKNAVKDAAKVFAVFDGHGGCEVAHFCQLYLIDVLTSQEEWKKDNADVGKALASCFHAIDRMVDDPEHRAEIEELKTKKPEPGERRTIQESQSRRNEESETSDEKNDQFNDEKKIESEASNTDSVSSPTEKEEIQSTTEEIDSDEDSTDVNGEIDDDRLDTSDEGTSNNDKDISGINLSAEDSITLFKKLLINKVGMVDLSESKDGDANETNVSEIDKQGITPTRLQNGKPVCNLPEHPIHAGCTSVCAIIVGNTLTVANAGDSRAVLCQKGGITKALSFDHKPMNEIEMKRIKAAGGFVNQFGRVNGNLNLSRSIGDLKYKQVPGIPPPEQMITAEPDIMQVTLDPDDEFLILACDGIWDCLTNAQAVDYVMSRIEMKKPTEIGAEMLTDIISKDPRLTQGIGGDNMTVMVVDLQPGKRACRQEGFVPPESKEESARSVPAEDGTK